MEAISNSNLVAQDPAALEKQTEFRTGIQLAIKAISGLPGAVNEAEMEKMCPTQHTYAEGIYVRQMFIPRGTVIVGKIHRHQHPNFIMCGRIGVGSEEFGSSEIVAPCHFVSKAGTQRIGLALEDTIWVTVHLNPKNLRDPEQLVKELTVESFEEFDALKAKGEIL